MTTKNKSYIYQNELGSLKDSSDTGYDSTYTPSSNTIVTNSRTNSSSSLAVGISTNFPRTNSLSSSNISASSSSSSSSTSSSLSSSLVSDKFSTPTHSRHSSDSGNIVTTTLTVKTEAYFQISPKEISNNNNPKLSIDTKDNQNFSDSNNKQQENSKLLPLQSLLQLQKLDSNDIVTPKTQTETAATITKTINKIVAINQKQIDIKNTNEISIKSNCNSSNVDGNNRKFLPQIDIYNNHNLKNYSTNMSFETSDLHKSYLTHANDNALNNNSNIYNTTNTNTTSLSNDRTKNDNELINDKNQSDGCFEYVTLNGSIIRSVIPSGKGIKTNYKVGIAYYAYIIYILLHSFYMFVYISE